MPTNKLNLLINFVARFQKSSRIDTDLNVDHINGIVITKTFIEVINTIINNFTNSSSFIISGAYGTGKSTFCLFLSSLLVRNPIINKCGFSKIGIDLKSKLKKLIKHKYELVPIIGQDQKFYLLLREELIAKKIISKNTRKTSKSILNEIYKSTNNSNKQILILVDEMGKFLENAAKGNDDAIFFQNLAELADRSKNKLLLIGVLHQSFVAYSENLNEVTQREWKKVQGRFVEIPLINTRSEQISLISESFKLKSSNEIIIENKKLINKLPKELKNSFEKNILCYPLHPVTACLISDISNSGIGQNQRTLYTFLSSGENGGLREFLETDPELGDIYMPYDLWRYVSSNSLIYSQNSKFSHKFHTANECLDKTQKLNDELAIKILKVIILSWIFGNQGLKTTKAQFLASLEPKYNEKKISISLDKLIKNSIVKYREHKKQFEPFEGSDFDLEEAVKSAGVMTLPVHIPLQSRPVIAHRHAVETGTLSYAFIYILNNTNEIPKQLNSIQHEFACFCIVLNNKFVPILEKNDKRILLWTIPTNKDEIKRKLKQLAVYKQLIKSSDIIGDQVARRELNEQIEYVNKLLDKLVNDVIKNTQNWNLHNSKFKLKKNINQSISHYLSEIASKQFNERVVIQNELLNRNKPSSSANSAIKILIKAILDNESSPRLGLATGWPVEVGIYYGIIHNTIHVYKNNQWKIEITEENSPQLYKLLSITRKNLESSTTNITLVDLYEDWSKPPYGITNGLMPLFSFLFYYVNREYISIYVNGVYHIDNSNNDWLIENWIYTKNIEFRWINVDKVDGKLIKVCQKALEHLDITVKGNCLSIARMLVLWFDKLPNWTKTNKNLSPSAKRLCNTLKKASDPNKLLLDDLPEILEIKASNRGVDFHVQKLIDIFNELQKNYEKLLLDVKKQIIETLNAKDWKSLQSRLQPLLDKTGNLEIKALIQKILDNDNNEIIERILEQVSGILNTDFTETNIKEARLNLSALLNRIRQIEINASAGRDTNLISIAMTGVSNKKDIAVVEEYVTKDDQKSIKKLAEKIEKLVNAGNLSKGVKIGAILKAIESIEKKKK